MTLFPRLRAIIRATPRGQSYEAVTIEKAVDTFISDITCVLTPDYLSMQCDKTLETMYWSWERTAIKYPEFESRLRQIMTNTKVYLTLPTEPVTAQEETNVVSLFSVH